eukprot:CAMPEP_0197523828 /NCGR_PEP_ID=MMETSP1318-20131121/8677_1 /TAXON_ID=552666 /ORGANISM="Partenskyella glossopodia, Strain RCC365" /LENGTH=207 /DNA_ID=CAMNT_0043076637 /DNA_START=354 /DNA_END=977 /DNA_ORIENTATION=+
MLKQYACGEQTDTYKKTVGTDFFEKEMTIKSTGEEVKLLLWDTAGQEMFKTLTQRYYKGAGAVVFAFATDNRQSFSSLGSWIQKVTQICPNITAVLVQNKIDLLHKSAVDPKEVEAFATKHQMMLFRTCALKNVLIDDVFDFLADQYLKYADKHGHLAVTTMGTTGGEHDDEKEQNDESGADDDGTVNVGPSKQRTKGKKKKKCIVM